MRILGIETSCDETAAAVLEVDRREFIVRSNIVASQVKIHAKTGGVVPEVAARAHVGKIVPVIEEALRQAGRSSLRDGRRLLVTNSKIDVIAVTAGPGLVTSLLVGVEVARTLAWLWRKPVVAVNHLAGHVYANWLNANGRESRSELSRMEFPALCLIVSGGHTELVLMRKHLDFKIIGETRDDAAGEAFDKVAKMLGLPYPGGPAVAAEAAKVLGVRDQVSGSKLKPKTWNLQPQFPRPMITSPDFDFSFSGLKTAVLYYLKSKNYLQQNKMRPHLKMLRGILPQICWEFQEAAVDVLVAKTIRAAKKYNVKTVLLGGGVAANTRLRQQLVNTMNSELPTIDCILPAAEYTGDNAAMIAAAGYFMAHKKQFTSWPKLEVDPNWELGRKFRLRTR